ncbi:MAG: conserved rane protein of unknown function [Clostridia bacterium]|jgi:hypothetical protein|nr:conserved rane protein of unknown function [Clostridia bacterium]
MIQLNQKHIINTVEMDSNWKTICRIGGVAAIMATVGTLLDIAITFLPGWGTSTAPETAIGWFTLFHDNWLLGLRNLDLLNVMISIFLIPTFCALYAIHHGINKQYTTLAITLFIVATTIFIGNNTALPMLELSSKYTAATTDTQRSIIAAAGEAMLARGKHGSPGAFMGFALSTLASISFAFIMLKGKIFSKATAYIGIIGFSLLLVYMVLVTFVSSSDNLIMMLAMPGGLLALGWNIGVAKKLLQLSKKEFDVKGRG